MSALAFKATYADWKLIKTRGVIQVVMEVPLADADAAYNVLGGMPDASREGWFAVAPLKLGKEAMPNPQLQPAIDAQPHPNNPRPDGAKRDWRDVQPAQQAGIRCSEATFAAFLKETHPDDWHESQDAAACVRLICAVHSRVELGTDHSARVIWHQLDTEYQAWLMKERVGA